jgi:hypothetical protein
MAAFLYRRPIKGVLEQARSASSSLNGLPVSGSCNTSSMKAEGSRCHRQPLFEEGGASPLPSQIPRQIRIKLAAIGSGFLAVSWQIFGNFND